MLMRRIIVLVLAMLVAAMEAPAVAAAQKQPVPKTPDQLSLAEGEVHILLLMDADKNGKVSKQEWMHFMELEIDRLDKNKTGELDVKELSQSRLRASRSQDLGK